MGEADSYYLNQASDLLQQAYDLQMQGQMADAISLYLKSIEFYPTAEAHTFLGWAYSLQGRYEEAIQECHNAIAIDPDFGNPYNDLGAYLIEKGRLDEAIMWLEKAAISRRYDAYFFPYYNLGKIWEAKGDWNKAIEYYKDSLRENPDYEPAKSALKRLQIFLN